MTDELLRPAQVAEMLNVTVWCLTKWRQRGVGPLPLPRQPGTRWIRYPRSAVEAWLRQEGAA